MPARTIRWTGARFIADSSNGALVKQIRFMGRASHAGGAPQLGINALSAAQIALNAIHCQRETFYDADTIRIHPIITKGGDAVSVVPADVTMETFVRGGSLEAIIDANMKVDRCLRAGAMAMGAEVEISTIPGYLPQRNDRSMGTIFGANVEACSAPAQFDIGGHRTGSTDMGDIAHLMPVIHPYVASAKGKTHGADFHIHEPQHAYLTPAKLLAMTAIDLLYDEAAQAREIIGEFKPAMTKDSLPRLRPRPVQEGAVFGRGPAGGGPSLKRKERGRTRPRSRRLTQATPCAEPRFVPAPAGRHGSTCSAGPSALRPN